MNDVLGQALLDYFNHDVGQKLWIHNTYGKKEEMPVKTYFREVNEMPDLELIALQNCRGKVLDIGAGAGSHSLELQSKGFDVTALEISANAVEVMNRRGVEKIIQEDIFSFEKDKFDTLLLLMNGIGLTANMPGLERFLEHAKNLINLAGQLIFDSSDIAYLYDHKIPKMSNYYGEISYSYQYKKQKTDWFTWLYIDQQTLLATAAKIGWNAEILFIDEYDQYLAKLWLKD